MLISQNDFQTLIDQAGDYHDYSLLVRKYLFHGLPFVFEGREGDYYDFRAAIANQWNVRFHEVMILGSAKLGYSYYKKTPFTIESDIDVAIVNLELFEQFVKAVSDIQYKIDNGLIRLTYDQYRRYSKFLEYLVKGWMRPDLLPRNMTGIVNQGGWFKYFRSISYGNSQVGNYKISAGLFKSFDYMERYYVESLKASRSNETNPVKPEQ